MVSTTDPPIVSGGIAHLAGIVYDHLGSLVALNLLWGVLCIPWIALAALMSQVSLAIGDSLNLPAAGTIGVGAGLFLCMHSPPTLLLLVATLPWTRGREAPSRQEVVKTLRARCLATQAIGTATAVCAGLLLANALFYHQVGGWFGAMLSGFMMWLVVALFLLSLYWLPLLARYPTRPVAQVLRQGLVLVFSKPVVTLYAATILFVLAVLGLASGVGWLCGLVTVGAIKANLIVGRLVGDADVEPPSRRSLRQILRPWE